ncbi:MAG: hypothetical protein U5R49_20830 [Deltaproteobacteria bacterium]|nr:hypothetical protein [Deltaproteobacteria bacterium]
MNVILYIIAVLWIACGTFLIVFTEKTRDTLKNMFLTERVKRLSLLPFVFGALLVIGAFTSSEIFWFVFILGILGLFKGVYFFMAPSEKTRRLLDWWFSKAKPETIRFWGLLTFFLGILLLSCIK